MSQRMCMRSGGHPLAACRLRWQTNGAARTDQASLCRAAWSWPRTHQRSAHGMCAQARLRLHAATREPLGLVVLLRVACEPELPHSLRLRLVHLPPRGRPVRRESGGPSTGRSDGTTQLTRHGYGTANTSAAHELSSTPAALRGHGQTIRPRRSVRGERQGAVRLQKRHTVHCARDERLPVHHLRTRHEV